MAQVRESIVLTVCEGSVVPSSKWSPKMIKGENGKVLADLNILHEVSVEWRILDAFYKNYKGLITPTENHCFVELDSDLKTLD